MPAVAWVTLVAAALVVGFTALGLLRVIVHLVAVHRNLAAVIGHVESVADATDTVPARLASVNASLKPVREWSEGV